MANNFSPEVADKLLDKLSSDDAFRELFQKDARAALVQVGHETAAKDVGVASADAVLCCVVKGLASKEVIRASRDKLRTMLTSTLPQMMFGICAS